MLLAVLPLGGAHTSSAVQPVSYWLAALDQVVQVGLSQSEAAVCAKLPVTKFLQFTETV